MKWIEVALETDGEGAEVIAEVLQRYGHQGVSVEQAGFFIETWEDQPPVPDKLLVRAYFADDETADANKHQIEEALWQLNRMYPMPTPRYTVINDEDWAEAWKVNYHPLRLGRHIYIRPLWIDEPGQPDDILIALDPGMAFGTGTHPSTQLVLEAAEDILEGYRNPEVVDLGCGSGILAIGAAKMGARQIIAVDTDPMSVRVTDENALQNGVSDKIKTSLGSLEQLLTMGADGSPYQFDVALVNILAKVIIAMCDQRLGEIVKPGGVAVFGGIIQEQAADVEAALVKTGLTPYKRRNSGDWVVIEARR